ncbi:unnamed protein product [Cyclocybe aegerita]|uniref:Uncharacterized protein n=1 Tax=Cyclocybe aegerita TaxID=1973307 RepID=A0A8S0X4C3_CYCAE|nr:unnamed protein product [Cyclocybe aegerita]
MSLADEFAAFARAYPYALPKCPEPEPQPMNDPTLFQFDDFMDVSPIDSSPLQQYDPQPIYSFMEFLRTANSELYEPTSTDNASVSVAQPQPTPEDPVLDADFWNSLMDADPALFEPSAVEDLLRKSFEDFGQDFWGMPYEEFKAKMEESQAQLECSWLPPDMTLPHAHPSYLTAFNDRSMTVPLITALSLLPPFIHLPILSSTLAIHLHLSTLHLISPFTRNPVAPAINPTSSFYTPNPSIPLVSCISDPIV